MPPPVRWLDEIGDVKAALGWVVAHAAEYHVNPARVSVMGGSAGGNLSMLAAYSVGDPRLVPSTDVPPVAIRSVIDFYGPSHMALLYRTCESPEYVRPLMKEYLGGAAEDFPDRYRLLSPLTHVTAKAPPTITVIGTSDRLGDEYGGVFYNFVVTRWFRVTADLQVISPPLGDSPVVLLGLHAQLSF